MGVSSGYRAKIEEARKRRDNGGSYVKAYIAQTKGPEMASNMQSKLQSWMDEHNAYVKSYSDRFSGRKEDGSSDTFVSDAADWYNTTTESGNRLRNTAQEILADLTKNRSVYGDEYVNEVSSVLQSGIDAYKGISDIAKADMDYWDQFKPGWHDL